MDAAPQTAANTGSIFFAYDFKSTSLKESLREICKAPGGQFDALGLDREAQTIYQLVWNRIAKADRLVAVLGDVPNVNVGFELGLALGLGKRVSVICWGSPKRHNWVGKTPPFCNFPTPGIVDASGLLDHIEGDGIWTPKTAEHLEKFKEPLPAGGVTYFVCPRGKWGSFYRRLQQMSFQPPRMLNFSLDEMPEAFDQMGRLIWVLPPILDGDSDANSDENAGNAVVAGWTVGRLLVSADPGSRDVTLRRDMLEDGRFHAFAVEPANHPADLETLWTSIAQVSDLEKRLAKISVPRKLITSVTGSSVSGPHPMLIQMAVMAVLSLSNNRINFAGEVLAQLNIDQIQFALLIHDPLTFRTKISTDRLKEFCQVHGLFNKSSDFDFFFYPPLLDGDGPDLTVCLECVNRRSDAGKALSRLVVRSHERRRIQPAWQEDIRGECGVLVNPTASTFEKNQALRRIYLRSARRFTPDEYEVLTEWDFGRDMWRRTIAQSQEGLPKDKWTHLHMANDFIRKKLATLVAARCGIHQTADRKAVIVDVLEGGVGGCNTTHYALRGLAEGLHLGGIQEDAIRFKYLGLEVNPQFADMADRILAGTSFPLAIDEGVPETDPRVQYFANLRKKGRLHPLVPGKSMVSWIEMADGVAALTGELAPNTVGLFVCSYAMHHVPNGVRLIEYLSAPSEGGLPRFASERPETRVQIVDELLYWLKHLDEENALKDALPMTRAVARGLGLPFPAVVKALVDEVEEFDSHRSGPLTSHLLVGLIKNRQLDLLRDVHSLLKPGGIVAIADPDGFSGFNRQHVPKNMEMAVAHFNSRADMKALLELAGFDIEDDHNQICLTVEKGRSEFGFDRASLEDLEGQSHTLADHNLGYIVFASKPTVRGA
jgi:SAM-dependent methyltransferase